MKSDGDPPRLRELGDGLPEGLGAALGRADDGDPTDADLKLMKQEVWLAIGLPPAGGAPSHAAPLAAAKASGVLGAGVMKGLGGATSTWLAWPAGIAITIVAGGAAILLQTPVGGPGTAASVVNRVAASSAPRAEAVPSEPGIPMPAENALRSAERAPKTAADAPLPKAPHPDPRASVALPSVRGEPASGTESSPSSLPLPPGPAETEVSLLGRAQQALRVNPAAALDLVSEHERRFGTGSLAQEREVIAIDALSRLGRKDEARARAARFHVLFPRSAHGHRVDVLVQ